MRFDGIKPSKHYKFNITEMNMDIVRDLNQMNPSNQIDANREKACNAIPKCTSLKEYLSITNGHDFVNLFCKISTNTNGQISIDSIETTLRGSFSVDDFKNTKLFNDLLTYQVINGITIVN